MTSEEKDAHDLKVFLYDLVKIKLDHNISEIGITKILELLRSDKNVWVPTTSRCNFPKTYTSLLTQLKWRNLPKGAETHIMCTNGCKVFKGTEITAKQKCDTCGGQIMRPTNRANQALPRAIYVQFPFIDRLLSMINNPLLRRHFYYAKEETEKREKEQSKTIRDVMDGKIWKDVAVPLIKKHPDTLFIFFLLSGDGVPIDKKQRQTILPYLVKILNFPPRLRKKCGILTVGLFNRSKESKADKAEREKWKKSTGGKTNQADLQELVNILNYLYRTGFEYTDEYGNIIKVRGVLICICGDIRAIPHCNHQNQSPALYGACTLCTIHGYKDGKMSTCYMRAAYFLDEENPIRLAWEEWKDKLPSEKFKLYLTERKKSVNIQYTDNVCLSL